MKYTRRSILRKASALSALTVGASGIATAADCSGIPGWESGVAYSGGDQVTYDGSLWKAKWWTKGTEPGSGGEWGPWTKVGSCGGGGGDNGDGGGGNQSPTASFTTSDSSITPGESITFDASSSSDADGSITSYEWDFDDGSTATGKTVTHTYDEVGSYLVTLTVTDDTGATATNTTTVSVGGGDGPGYTGNRVVAYYMQWAQYGRGFVPKEIPTDKVTHLQWAFFVPESDGSIHALGGAHGQQYIFPQPWQEGNYTYGELAADTDIVCLLSIGGWNDSGNFSDAALTQERRQHFADECVRIIRKAGVNGVDIDWEYPGGGGKEGNAVRSGDQHRFTLLLEAIRDALDQAGQEDGEYYHLSIAASAAPDIVQGVHEGNHGLEHDRLQQVLDFVSVMTFDYNGAWSDYTDHQAPLYHNPESPNPKAEKFNVESSMQYWRDQGWDPAKLNMAMPFYCRSFGNVGPVIDAGNGVDDGLYQDFSGAGDGTWSNGTGVYDYWDVSPSNSDGRDPSQVDISKPGWKTYYDDTAVSTWSYNQEEGEMISHESPKTVEKKMTWLDNSDYGGTMIWALSHDTTDFKLLTTLSNTLL